MILYTDYTCIFISSRYEKILGIEYKIYAFAGAERNTRTIGIIKYMRCNNNDKMNFNGSVPVQLLITFQQYSVDTVKHEVQTKIFLHVFHGKSPICKRSRSGHPLVGRRKSRRLFQRRLCFLQLTIIRNYIHDNNIRTT